MINKIEIIFQTKAIINYENEKPGDVPFTCANIEKAKNVLGYYPKVVIDEGLHQFNDWFINVLNKDNLKPIL